ncbi:hypothetical protein PCH_Pc12g06210 [Penicillium rubens Wisconsin 54-1255]|uniref:Uncharacterized protein n=1 Tax=Penicillium rubens (strain ATCC 28089 / DSM 1075 / NRRL 1951 / Wisconsin 54-1255) TaxID=500485 RepID=B6H054_PENRW|nr:hypothetical protein PCH_Pc12g06210 [Penicillium rubens Wisconsin 54-1255]
MYAVERNFLCKTRTGQLNGPPRISRGRCETDCLETFERRICEIWKTYTKIKRVDSDGEGKKGKSSAAWYREEPRKHILMRYNVACQDVGFDWLLDVKTKSCLDEMPTHLGRTSLPLIMEARASYDADKAVPSKQLEFESSQSRIRTGLGRDRALPPSGETLNPLLATHTALIRKCNINWIVNINDPGTEYPWIPSSIQTLVQGPLPR